VTSDIGQAADTIARGGVDWNNDRPPFGGNHERNRDDCEGLI
jgi:hypothetical protein